MGYMSLSHWVDSDGAADFRFTLQKVVGKKDEKFQIQKLVREELKDDANEYNTAGCVNIALVLEDEGRVWADDPEEPMDITPKFSQHLTKKDFQDILAKLEEKIEQCGASFRDEWGGDDSNRRWHQESFRRMQRSVKRIVKQNGKL